HPEYEIVYIPRGNGRRHIGKHISRYVNGELIFIGPNIPHLNFGFGVTDSFEEYVIQMKEDFIGKDFGQVVEFQAINWLFKLSHKVVVFGNETKKKVGDQILALNKVNGFERLMILLNVLYQLANSNDYETIDAEIGMPQLQPKEQERFSKIHRYIEENFMKEIDFQEVADVAGLTLPAFCRYFKKMTQMTFTDFVNEFRINHARNLLLQGQNITTIGYEVGFNNLSHFNRTFKKIMGTTPSEYLKKVSLMTN
nr:AraC family transcriptional regulator [Spirosomataceae bacterium]